MFEHSRAGKAGAGRAGIVSPLSGVPGPDLAAALDALDEDMMSDAEIVEEIQAWERMKSWVDARQNRAILRLARRRPCAGAAIDSSQPLAGQISEYLDSELAVALGVSRPTAGRRLGFALALDELPATLDALATGQLSYGKIAALVDATTVLPPAVTAAVETAVLPGAADQTPGEFRAALASAVLEADPAHAAKRHTQAVTDRKVWLSPETDGMATLGAFLPAPEALAAYNALTRIAKKLAPSNDNTPSNNNSSNSNSNSGDVTSTTEDAAGTTDTVTGTDVHGRTLDQRRADALTYLLTTAVHPVASASSHSRADGDGPPAPPGPNDARDDCRVPMTAALHADIRIVVPAGTLLGLTDTPAELPGYGPIPAPVARAIAHHPNSTWRRILLDPPTGALLENDRRTYRPSPALEDYIRTRDATCRFPGCRQPATTADLDHTTPHAQDGPTTPTNLAALCRSHHRLKTHNPHWHVQQHPDGTLTWTTPTGTTHTTHPKFPNPSISGPDHAEAPNRAELSVQPPLPDRGESLLPQAAGESPPDGAEPENRRQLPDSQEQRRTLHRLERLSRRERWDRQGRHRRREEIPALE